MNNKKILWILFVLAVTQVIGWGTISLPAVIGERLAHDIGLSLPAVFAGSTTMLVVTGICALLLSNAFVRYGARHCDGGGIGGCCGRLCRCSPMRPVRSCIFWLGSSSVFPARRP